MELWIARDLSEEFILYKEQPSYRALNREMLPIIAKYGDKLRTEFYEL